MMRKMSTVIGKKFGGDKVCLVHTVHVMHNYNPSMHDIV